MTKRKKVILLCLAIAMVAGLGITIPLLVGGEDSSQSSTTDTSSTEVSVSTSNSLLDSTESASEEIHQSSHDVSSEEVSSDSEESCAIDSDSDESSDHVSQTSDSMSEANESSAPETSSPIVIEGLGSHSLSIPYAQGNKGVVYSFTVPETGLYAISSASITSTEERFALVYTIAGVSEYVTNEKQTLFLQKDDVVLFTAYLYDDFLFIGSNFPMDLSLTRQLALGENDISLVGECVVYFLPPTSGEYIFTASGGVRIFSFSPVTLRNEEITQPLMLTAGIEIRLVLQADGEQQTTVTIQSK